MAESHPGAHEAASLSYTMAYFVLPHYVFNDMAKLRHDLAQKQPLGVLFFYVVACKARGKEPDIDLLPSFEVFQGRLNDDYDYHIIQYPTPPPVNIADLPEDELVEAMQTVVLAPYFSAVIEDSASGRVQYFTLGQSPDGKTTFRSLTPTLNANLGRGCEPEIGQFLAFLRERVAEPGQDSRVDDEG